MYVCMHVYTYIYQGPTLVFWEQVELDKRNLTSCVCQVDLSLSPLAPLQITRQVTAGQVDSTLTCHELVKSSYQLRCRTLTYKCTYICIYIHVCIHVYLTRTCDALPFTIFGNGRYVCVYVCRYESLYVYMYVYMYVCMCVYVNTHVGTYIYIYIHMYV